eukprot:TRINITY_DN72943_c0_g1_i1.p1 TRINITY_DN72943_c0_g1~~TRINITY_DN72943_c0_g1_i1.p1  ORF type:complete len:194 (+),score=29.64 TRINITY_DN72943_c0_g1_i1:57-638(+)
MKYLAVAAVALAWILSAVGYWIEARDAKQWDKGATILDRQPGWSPADVRALFDTIGSDGMKAYARYHLVLDSWYPFVYSSALVSLLALGRCGAGRMPWLCGKLVGAPLITIVMDELENFCITWLSVRYEQTHNVADFWWIGSICTVLKFASALLFFAIGIGGVLCSCRRSRSRRAGAFNDDACSDALTASIQA